MIIIFTYLVHSETVSHTLEWFDWVLGSIMKEQKGFDTTDICYLQQI